MKKTNNQSVLLSEEHLNLVRKILSQSLPQNSVWVFGSRVAGNAKPHSDLDMVIIDPPAISETQITVLKLNFEDSDLPFRVDVLIWSQIDPHFRDIISKNHIVL